MLLPPAKILCILRLHCAPSSQMLYLFPSCWHAGNKFVNLFPTRSHWSCSMELLHIQSAQPMLCMQTILTLYSLIRLVSSLCFWVLRCSISEPTARDLTCHHSEISQSNISACTHQRMEHSWRELTSLLSHLVDRDRRTMTLNTSLIRTIPSHGQVSWMIILYL